MAQLISSLSDNFSHHDTLDSFNSLIIIDYNAHEFYFNVVNTLFFTVK